MPSGLLSIPVVSFLPVAGFVNPAYGGRKPATKIEWTAQQVKAEELACVLAIPNAFIDDAGYPIWEQVRPLVSTAIADALDVAVLFGTGAPASFPTGGIAGLAGAAQTGATALEAIDAAAASVEASGGVPNGIAAGSAIGTALRQAYQAVNVTPDVAPANVIYGWPVEVIPSWDSTKGDALVGDWNMLLVGVREDITFDLSEEAIIQDNTGAIIANAFQEDLTAMRCYIRVGVAVGQPLTPSGAVAPFEFADWTA
jgi:HK97 family phage major capsid protein